MSNTTFITAFFDIGRSNWSAKFPRSNGSYFNYFSRLTGLENKIICYTSHDLVDKIKSYSLSDDVEYIVIDFNDEFGATLKKIKEIHESDEWKSKFPERALALPDYSIPEYVTVTNQKVWFVQDAIERGLVTTEWAGWIDFGFVREAETLADTFVFNTTWNDNKIHLFTRASLKSANIKTLSHAIFGGNDYIMGGSILGKKEVWRPFKDLYYKELDTLLNGRIADDDQGVLLSAYITNPSMFSIIETQDWFYLFKYFKGKIS